MSEDPALIQLFWSKVNKNGPVKDSHLGQCWEWSACRTRKGYGHFWIPENKQATPAHRFAWKLEHGNIPKGMHILHHCDNPMCIRHDHLFLGTNDDNVRDRVIKGRSARTQGERNPNAKINQTMVQLVRELYVRGSREFGTVALGRLLGISSTQVRLIVTGQSWKCLE